MSIETRVVPFSRSVRTLIKNTRRMAKSIKDLKDLSVLGGRAGYRHSGPTDLKRTRDVFSVVRTLARDRPSPYGEGWVAFCFVERGPVPRELHRHDVCFPSVVRDRPIPNGSRSGDLDLQAWRENDGEGQALALR